MNNFLDRLLSLNFWVAVFSVLAAGGIVCSIFGFVLGVRSLAVAGLWLGAPLVLGGLVLLVVTIPIIVWANWRQQRK